MARVLISMKDDFLKQIDDLATDEQRTRSELIREALRLYMRRINAQTLQPTQAQSMGNSRASELLNN